MTTVAVRLTAEVLRHGGKSSSLHAKKVLPHLELLEGRGAPVVSSQSSYASNQDVPPQQGPWVAWQVISRQHSCQQRGCYVGQIMAPVLCPRHVTFMEK